jgi:hypothetical protein
MSARPFYNYKNLRYAENVAHTIWVKTLNLLQKILLRFASTVNSIWMFGGKFAHSFFVS